MTIQYVVLQGLIFDEKKVSSIKPINNFFKSQKWGKLKYKTQLKTKAGQGGSGGRNDVIFAWSGTQKEMGRFAVQRFGLEHAPRWLEDYIANNMSIIPVKKLEDLKKLTTW